MISIIICSIDRARFDAVCRNYAAVLGSEPFEIIGIHDARSMCEGYNRGFAQAKGDIIIFSHDDVEHWSNDFALRLRRHLERYDIIGIAGTTRLVGPMWLQAGPPFSCGVVISPDTEHTWNVLIFGTAGRTSENAIPNIQALDGVFIACHRRVAERLPWDEQTFTGFHGYDVDWTFRAFRENFRLAVALDLPIFHRSDGNYGKTWEQAAASFTNKHQAALAQVSHRKFRYGLVSVPTKQDALEIFEVLNA